MAPIAKTRLAVWWAVLLGVAAAAAMFHGFPS